MNKRSATRGAPARHPAPRQQRPAGREWRIAAWLARHPLFVVHPLVAVAAVATVGSGAAAAGYAVLACALVCWWRAHPASFDRWVAPRIRSAWRRWTDYRGRRWASVLTDCGLTRQHPGTGETLVPRITRARSASASIDVLTVRMARGQDPALWQESAAMLADALLAHRVAIARTRPGVLTVVVERTMPFDRVIPALDIPATSAEVDLRAVPIGENEHGELFTVPLVGAQALNAGASGSGKASLMWSLLRGVGPCIRDSIVRVRMVDLKGGVETEQGAPLFHRWATTPDEAITVLTEFRDRMRVRLEWMRDNGIRKCTPSLVTPVEVLMIDEMAMLTAYSDRSTSRTAELLLSEVMTQGRAPLFVVRGYLQEPSKDVLGMRDLFTDRTCLGVTAASHVDMVLGDGARDRGALADEIPGDEAHAGIGFVIAPGSRMPVRFRAAFVSDDDIAELVARCAPRDADVIDLHPHTSPDDQDGWTDEDDEDGDERTAGAWT